MVVGRTRSRVAFSMALTVSQRADARVWRATEMISLDVTIAPTPMPARLPAGRFRFPDPNTADAEGLVAHGADLEPATLIAAYRRGVFPGRTTSGCCSGGRRTLGDPAAGRPARGPAPGPHAAPGSLSRHAQCRLWSRSSLALCGARGDVDHAGHPRGLRAAAPGRAGPTAWKWWADGGLAGGLYGLACGGIVRRRVHVPPGCATPRRSRWWRWWSMRAGRGYVDHRRADALRAPRLAGG